MDQNKGITAITYNHLNLPVRISFGSTKRIDYLYDAAGTKIRKTVVNGSTTTTTDYSGNFIYENNVLKFIQHAQGYVAHTLNSSNGSEFNYVYQYKDHLGNNRVSYAYDSDSNSVKIIDDNHYYPFGLEMEFQETSKNSFSLSSTDQKVKIMQQPDSGYKYKFNGKELEEDLGLNTYDYGARNYDAALGRWMTVDPLSDFENRQ